MENNMKIYLKYKCSIIFVINVYVCVIMKCIISDFFNDFFD